MNGCAVSDGIVSVLMGSDANAGPKAVSIRMRLQKENKRLPK